LSRAFSELKKWVKYTGVSSKRLKIEPFISSLHGIHSDPIGFAVGEYLPLPRSKGGAFPFLLTSMGTPLFYANFRSKIKGSLKTKGNSCQVYV
jgi:hypothetical protein